jgi:hypothetical protein
LCNGPVHVEPDGEFECAIGHHFDGESMRGGVNLRLSTALWMAIEALDNEATTLRVLEASPDAARWAEEAAEQAQLLRDFARLHAPRGRGDDDA